VNDRQLAAMLIEKVADANINKKIAVFVNRLILRLHSQPALLSNLSDITVFKPGFEGETVDQVEDGEFKESVDDLDTANAPAKEDEEKDANTSVILQLSFRRLPQEVITPLIRLLASPREPKLFQYTKDGAARFGVEIELRPSDFPGDDLDYSF
jgi:hypothetical protein